VNAAESEFLSSGLERMQELRETEPPPPLYINIGEAARLIGISSSTLRAWERRGLIAADRSPAGYRRFTLADIERLRQMKRAGPRFYSEDLLDDNNNDGRRDVASARSPGDGGAAPWGQRLREQRLARCLSLRQVATLTGLSASYISGIERGLAHPSVAALQKLTAAYSVSIVDLMEAGVVPRGRLVRAADRQRYDPADGVTMEQLNFGDHVMELHLFTVEPGAGTGGAFEHEGEEFIMMLEGTLRVSIDAFEHYILEPGDVLYFESCHRHQWTSPGPTVTVFLGVNTPRTF
jgi:transcriptional regulator with XRE-family HTH domain